MAFEFISMNIKQEPPIDFGDLAPDKEDGIVKYHHCSNEVDPITRLDGYKDCQGKADDNPNKLNDLNTFGQINMANQPTLFCQIPGADRAGDRPAPKTNVIIPSTTAKTATVAKRQQLFDYQLALLHTQLAQERLEQDLHRQSIKHDREVHELKMMIYTAKLRQLEPEEHHLDGEATSPYGISISNGSSKNEEFIFLE